MSVPPDMSAGDWYGFARLFDETRFTLPRRASITSCRVIAKESERPLRASSPGLFRMSLLTDQPLCRISGSANHAATQVCWIPDVVDARWLLVAPDQSSVAGRARTAANVVAAVLAVAGRHADSAAHICRCHGTCARAGAGVTVVKAGAVTNARVVARVLLIQLVWRFVACLGSRSCRVPARFERADDA